MNEDGVGRHPISFGEHHDIAAHHLATSDSSALAIANDQRPGTGEVAQRLQDALGAGFLNHRDQNRQCREGKQNQRFLQVAKRQIDCAATEQQRQHGLAHDLEHDAQRRAPVGPW